MGGKNQIQRKILFRNKVSFLGRDNLYYAKLSEEKLSFNSDLCHLLDISQFSILTLAPTGEI